MEILYAVGFFCGVSNVVGGAAYQVLLAQLAGRNRLVEANAKIALGETSSALVGPGLAGLLIQLLTAPFAIVLDAVTFFASALMLRRIHAPNDVPHPGPNKSVWAEIVEGLKLVLAQPHAAGAGVGRGPVATAAPHAARGADPVRDARARTVGRRHRPDVHVRRPGLCARRGIRRKAVGALRCRAGHRARSHPDRGRLAGLRPDRRPGVVRDAGAGVVDAALRLRRGAVRHQLPGTAAGDHARPAARADDGDDALLHGGRGAAGFARGRRCSPRRSGCAGRSSRSACWDSCCPARPCCGRPCASTARCPRWPRSSAP